jgi:hypothetical protein
VRELGAGVLSQPPARVGTVDVEVAQDRGLEATAGRQRGAGVGADLVLGGELGRAVGVDRHRGRVLRDGHRGDVAVGGAGGRVDQALHLVHYCNIIEAPWLVNGGHGASFRHHK